MARLKTLKPRIAMMDTRRAGMLASGERKPFADSSTAHLRLRGRALQARNARIKVRDLYTCQACGRVTDELEIDHIVPLSASGGTDGDDNLQCLCPACHAAKTKREAAGRV